MDMRAPVKYSMFAACLVLTTGLHAEETEDRALTEYEQRMAEDGQRIEIWNSQRVIDTRPGSVTGIEQDQSSVGMQLEGGSLSSTAERMMQSPEFQAFEGQIDTQTQALGELGGLVTELENGSVWELMEPVVGNWSVTATTGSALWTPRTWTVTDSQSVVQEKDGSATKQRLVEVYEKNRSTGEERLVDSYVQETTQYEFDRRSVIAAENPDTGEQPVDYQGWSAWVPVSEKYGYSEWLPKRENIWAGLPFYQVQHYTQDHERYKWIYKFVSPSEQTFLEEFTQTSVSGDSIFDEQGTKVADKSCAFCFGGSEYSSAPEGGHISRSTTGTKPLPGNGCYYDTSEVAYNDPGNFTRWGVKYEDEYGAVSQKSGNPKYVIKTYYSSNQYTGGDHIVYQAYFDGVELLGNAEPSSASGGVGCIMVCGGFGGSPGYAPVMEHEFWFGDVAEAQSVNGIDPPDYIYPVRTARNSNGAVSNTNYTATNTVLTKDLPFIWDGGRKEWYIGAKKTDRSEARTGIFGNNSWTDRYRTYQICMRNR
ncbi:hypothetical protein AWH63_10415 [Marinobacter sp. C18]|uniref:hypothetical protein n=1 Tax=Marinobacter sp. C18 TaxID=1772288 RepID=UPI000948F3B3|nr:hypothetical protein [Marinobacter sp. C18]OLF81945.1 hypothetical protein AWH63_10415 [Marinobacter sp. C18]